VSLCGPFRPSLRSFCGPACREQPGTSENSLPRFPAFVRVYRSRSRDLQGSEPATFHRGVRFELAFSCGFLSLCGLFAVPNHEPSPRHRAALWPSGRRCRLRRRSRAQQRVRRSAARSPTTSANRRRRARRASGAQAAACSASISMPPGFDCKARPSIGLVAAGLPNCWLISHIVQNP
jgi:hypothetical protein